MNAQEREALRLAVDAKLREALDLNDCGGSASLFRYRQGCRCKSCRAVSSACRRRYYAANREAELERHRAYRRRRREERAA